MTMRTKVSETMIDYFASFIATGDPNGEGRAKWTSGNTPMHFSKKQQIAMHRRPTFKLLRNTLKGDPV